MKKYYIAAIPFIIFAVVILISNLKKNSVPSTPLSNNSPKIDINFFSSTSFGISFQYPYNFSLSSATDQRAMTLTLTPEDSEDFIRIERGKSLDTSSNKLSKIYHFNDDIIVIKYYPKNPQSLTYINDFDNIINTLKISSTSWDKTNQTLSLKSCGQHFSDTKATISIPSYFHISQGTRNVYSTYDFYDPYGDSISVHCGDSYSDHGPCSLTVPITVNGEKLDFCQYDHNPGTLLTDTYFPFPNGDDGPAFDFKINYGLNNFGSDPKMLKSVISSFNLTK